MNADTDNPGARQLAWWRWSAFALGCCAFFISFFHRVSTGAIAADLQHEFAIGAAALGTLGATYFYVYALDAGAVRRARRHAGPARDADRRHADRRRRLDRLRARRKFHDRGGCAHARGPGCLGRLRVHAEAAFQLVSRAALCDGGGCRQCRGHRRRARRDRAARVADYAGVVAQRLYCAGCSIAGPRGCDLVFCA